jgi:acyl-CoA reductase-like NAD-dependent aldehyde dehydrogenase
MTSSGFLLIFREKDVMTYQSLNPATGEFLKKFDELTDKELETKIAAAAACFDTWRHKNVLMVKHAGCVPQCAMAFEKVWIEAGAPAALYTNLLISHDQSDRVVDDPRIKGVALTGSVSAGRSIAARAGQNLKVSSMELGGSDAFIVLDDADLEHTVKWAVWGRMYNTGQTCCAAKRFIVVEKLADKFLGTGMSVPHHAAGLGEQTSLIDGRCGAVRHHGNEWFAVLKEKRIGGRREPSDVLPGNAVKCFNACAIPFKTGN